MYEFCNVAVFYFVAYSFCNYHNRIIYIVTYFIINMHLIFYSVLLCSLFASVSRHHDYCKLKDKNIYRRSLFAKKTDDFPRVWRNGFENAAAARFISLILFSRADDNGSIATSFPEYDRTSHGPFISPG